jgi:hypothetical protein
MMEKYRPSDVKDDEYTSMDGRDGIPTGLLSFSSYWRIIGPIPISNQWFSQNTAVSSQLPGRSHFRLLR